MKFSSIDLMKRESPIKHKRKTNPTTWFGTNTYINENMYCQPSEHELKSSKAKAQCCYERKLWTLTHIKSLKGRTKASSRNKYRGK